MEERLYAVYLISNPRHTVYYIGVTNDLCRRMIEHRTGAKEGFAKKYNCTELLFFETTTSVEGAIAREKELKGKTRAKKEALIVAMNPEWKDLYETIW